MQKQISQFTTQQEQKIQKLMGSYRKLSWKELIDLHLGYYETVKSTPGGTVKKPKK